jgi:stage II sporulation protein GA (sporulation sigma-E factor processing peptidase)
MTQIIYIDVLILLNIIITFLLLLGTSSLLSLSPKPIRYMAGSLLGGASSLVILMPEMGFVLSILTKLIFSFLIVVSVYGPKRVPVAIKETAYFFAVSFIFAGMMMFAASLPGVSLVQYRNGAAYINLSFFSLISACVVCYVITFILGRITSHKASGDIKFSVIIGYGGVVAETQAILDTGNALTDPFTGESVIVGDIACLKTVMPTEIRKYYNNEDVSDRLRLLPCKTVSSETLLPCFRPDRVEIKGGNTSCILKKPLVAVSRQPLDCLIVPPMLFENSERRKKNVKA